MTDLADFLLARIADAEDVVRQYRQVWGEDESSPFHPYVIEKDGPYLSIDPAFVLAECEAKRRIVEAHRSEEAEGVTVCAECGPEEDVRFRVETYGRGYPCLTLRLLALPYADHDQYREEWRP